MESLNMCVLPCSSKEVGYFITTLKSTEKMAIPPKITVSPCRLLRASPDPELCSVLPCREGMTSVQSTLQKYIFYFDHYVWRLFNRKPPYDDLKNKVDSYFKQLTGDNGVGFSLSSTSMLYFNEKAKWYIDQYRVFM